MPAPRTIVFELPPGPHFYKGGIDAWRSDAEKIMSYELKAAGLKAVHEPVAITVDFYIPTSTRRADIDNMIKVLVDTLGAAGLFATSKGGGRRSAYNTEDHWVHEIHARKHDNAKKPGVVLKVSIGA